MRLHRLAFSFTLALFVLGCGGGGGSDGGSTDSGSTNTKISPSSVNVGSLAFLSVKFNQADFDDLDTQGITLKLLIPSDLALVPSSPTLTLNRGGIAIAPLAVIPVSDDFAADELEAQGLLGSDSSVDDNEFTMYVFPLDAALLNDEDEGTLQATFQVNEQPAHPVVLTDIDRGAVTSFDIDHADFDAESATSFTVLPAED